MPTQTQIEIPFVKLQTATPFKALTDYIDMADGCKLRFVEGAWGDETIGAEFSWPDRHGNPTTGRAAKTIPAFEVPRILEEGIKRGYIHIAPVTDRG